MHPPDRLFSGCEAVNAVSFSEKILGLLGQFLRLSLASLLDQCNVVAAMLVIFADVDGGAFACYEHILFLVHCGAVLGEYQDVAVIRRLGNAH